MKFSFCKRISALVLALALALSLLPHHPADSVVSDAPFTAYAADYDCDFADTELFLCEGASMTPALRTALPEGAYFVSDNPEVVAVDPFSGNLTCSRYGYAVISLYAPAPEEPEVPEEPDASAPAEPEAEVQSIQPIRAEVYDDSAFATPLPGQKEQKEEIAPLADDTMMNHLTITETALEEEASAVEGEVTTEEEPVIDTLSVEPQIQDTDVLLDTLKVYCYRPSTYSIKDTKLNSGKAKGPEPYRYLTVYNPTEDFSEKRVYSLFKQQFDSKNYPWLNDHGCSTVAVADICQGYGISKITPIWLYEKGISALAKKNGLSASTIDKKLTADGDPLGWYGMKAILDYAGIPCAIRTWDKKDNSEAVEGITEALYQGHPVVIMIHNYTWTPTDTRGNTRKLSKMWLTEGGNHFIILTGIDENGYVLNSCGSNANCQTTNKYTDSPGKVKLTVKEVLDHFVRMDKKPVRTDDDDFFFSYGGGSGTCVWLEVLENEAHDEPIVGSIENMTAALSEDEFVYDGKEHKPTVSIDGLVENADFEIVGYENNVNAGTASVTVRGIHSYYGELTKEFTIKKATEVLSVQNKTVATASKKQTFPLGAMRLLDNGKLTYKSSNPKNISVGSAGNVSVAKNFVGKETITVATPTTVNTEAQSKDVTITVIPKTPSFSYAKSPKKKALQLKWKSASVSGYQVQYAYDSKFEGARTYTTSKKSAKSKKITGLASKKTVYVRMRTYKKSGGVVYWSKWSKVKKVTIK